jgi:hypothetical protein
LEFTDLINGTVFKITSINFIMRDWLRTLIAGYAGYKWGGGCLGTIVVFMLVYWALGHC